VFHADFDLPMARILHTDCPHYAKYAEPGETEEEYATRLARNLEAMIDPRGETWDFAAVAVLIREAGGRFTSLSGTDAFDAGDALVSNGPLHQAVLDELGVSKHV
jgi:fructose-1,6-bisphosphatase/inositol monophosphatase family enzyme